MQLAHVGVAHRPRQRDQGGAIVDGCAVGEGLRIERESVAADDFDRAGGEVRAQRRFALRSEEHTSELQSLMRISYAVFCLKKKKNKKAIRSKVTKQNVN